MWIVRLALRRTYTFIVLAVLIAVLGAVSTNRMATDVFPEADIPVVSIVWQFSGMPPDEIESRLILITERVLTTSVNDIEHIESQSLTGVGVMRVYFQPGAKIEAAVAQTTATCQTLLKIMPPGITPPYIVRYNATSVPVVQIAMSSDTLSLWSLYITQTTLSVPALMGAIMCVGVATSNSILLVTFANDRRKEGADAHTAAQDAGSSRRPRWQSPRSARPRPHSRWTRRTSCGSKRCSRSRR